MMTIQNPKTTGELVKLVAKHGKRLYFASGVDPNNDRAPAGKVVIDVGNVVGINEIETRSGRVAIGTGLHFGRLARDARGDNGLLRQAASLIANPLVRNRITLLQALDPESPYFDITTPLVLLDARIKVQGLSGKRTIAVRDYLESGGTILKKGEVPVQIDFATLESDDRVGFFRVARMGGKGSVSAAARMKLVRNVCKQPEIVVSSLSLIPLRTKAAEKEIEGHAASEGGIKRSSAIAASEILDLAESKNTYERSLIEIAVGRTLRTIMEGSIPA